MSQDDSPKNAIARTRTQFIRKSWLLVAMSILCVASLAVGRFAERRANQMTSATNASRPNAIQADKHDKRTSSRDNEKCQEIANLNGQVSEMNWELVTPFKEFETGEIDAAALRERTAKPELKILRLCTRMYKLANDVENTKTRDKVVNFAAAVLQRHRGFSMMIEGISLDDASRIAEGAKLFEDGRNKAIAAAIEFTGPDSPHTAHLKRLHDAYQPSDITR